MNKNILIVMGGGLLVAVLVAMLVKFGLGSGSAVKEEGRTEILVASRDLKVGDELSDGNMKWAPWPESAVFSAAIRRKDAEQKPEEALTGRLSRSIAQDEPLVKSAVVKEDKGNFVAAVLRPGYRAVAIGVKAESMVGGFITPGDFVDVVLTYKIKFDDNDDPLAKRIIDQNIDQYATETILENVKILAIDQTSKNDDPKIKVGKTVTLEVDSLGAEKLSLASEMGPLTLALRGIGDDLVRQEEQAVTTDLRMTRITEQLSKEYENARSGVGDTFTPAASSVRIYNGATVQGASSR